MLIIALVLAVIGLAALVTAVVTSNAVVAWVCIGASVLGVILLIVDAIRERQRGEAEGAGATEADGSEPSGEAIDATYQNFDAEYPDDEPVTQVILDEPVPAEPVAKEEAAGSDTPSDQPAEEAPAGSTADEPADEPAPAVDPKPASN